jgi:transposase, IS5 family
MKERSHEKMRKRNQKQMPLIPRTVDHPHARELEFISQILDKIPTINELAWQDLTQHVEESGAGAEGMSAEQVVRCAIVKQMEDYSYDELAFHIVDSSCYRHFCRIGIAHKGFKKSALCHTIKSLSSATWEAINRMLMAYAKAKKIEKGREVRIDSTVVSSNIHTPSDSSLLWDSVRVFTRVLSQAKSQVQGFSLPFTDHTKRAKRRMIAIMNAREKKSRTKHYRDLLKVATKTLTYAERAGSFLTGYLSPDPTQILLAQKIAEEIETYTQLTRRVIDQTERRVLHGELVPASEKIVSLFESHADIIVKDHRDTFYGHKLCLTGGASNLITDCLICEGNPADTSLADQMLDRQRELYARYPLKVAFDGGFASKENLNSAKSKHITDVCFAKKRGIEIEEMCRSPWVYKRLRRFRAGVESGISWLKRCFGLCRCTWRGFQSFQSYVWASIVSANLVTLARKEMA